MILKLPAPVPLTVNELTLLSPWVIVIFPRALKSVVFSSRVIVSASIMATVSLTKSLMEIFTSTLMRQA